MVDELYINGKKRADISIYGIEHSNIDIANYLKSDIEKSENSIVCFETCPLRWEQSKEKSLGMFGEELYKLIKNKNIDIALIDNYITKIKSFEGFNIKNRTDNKYEIRNRLKEDYTNFFNTTIKSREIGFIKRIKSLSAIYDEVYCVIGGFHLYGIIDYWNSTTPSISENRIIKSKEL